MVTEIKVEGMSCEGCERTVVEALEEVEGIETATADHTNSVATVKGSASVMSLIEAISDAGYHAHTS